MMRILHIYPQMNNAGTEKVILNLAQKLEEKEIIFDYCLQKAGAIDEKLRSMGSKLYYVPNSKHYSDDIKGFFASHTEYKTIHTHTHKEMGAVLKAAKDAGISNRIAHSHNFRGDLPRIFKIFKMIDSMEIEKNATHFVACSTEAAEWLFPRKHKQCMILNNGIDLPLYKFNALSRERIRNEFNIPQNARVICHVGRFSEQKNHEKIVSVLNKLIAIDHNIYAILVGEGPLRDRIERIVDRNNVIFCGSRTDVPDILSASDLFLFPSRWEGLGIVAVEAQASGIECIASTRVPRSADVGVGLFQQISLSKNDDDWVNAILKALNAEVDREKIIDKCIGREYDLNLCAEKAYKLYSSF